MTHSKLEGLNRRGDVSPVHRLRTADVAAMLRRRIHWGMHLGLVKTGDRLPSLRAASAEFGVDQRSVLAAYRELEAEGIVVMRPRSGIYVAGDRPGGNQLPPSSRWMAEMFLQGFARGVPPIALGPALVSAVNASSITAACLECNADQILWLASQLRSEFGLSTTWVDIGALTADALAERVQGANLIVTTTFHGAEARALGEEFGVPVVIATTGRDQSASLRAELSRGPVYFIGTDERYAQKLLQAGDSARWMANLRPMVLDQHSLNSLPANAPVVVTRAVAEILGAERLPRGAGVVDYPFGAETRSEIISIMLSAMRPALEAACDGCPESLEPVVSAAFEYVSAAEPELPSRRAALRDTARAFAHSEKHQAGTLADLIEDALRAFDQLAESSSLPRDVGRLRADFISWLVEDFKSQT